MGETCCRADGCTFSFLPGFEGGGSNLPHPREMRFVQWLSERMGGFTCLSDGQSAFPLEFFECLHQFSVNLTEKQQSPIYLSSSMFC